MENQLENKLIDIFFQRNLLSKHQLDAAFREQKQTQELLIEVIIRLGLADREKVSRIWAEAIGYPYYDLKKEIVDFNAVRLVPHHMAERFHLIPIKSENGNIHIAMYNPGNVIAIDALRRATHKDIKIYVANIESIGEAISTHYREGIVSSADEIDRLASMAVRGSVSEDKDPPAVRIIDLLIEKAIIDRATDIHISPDEKATRISFRIDGIMRPINVLPKQIHSQIITRVKVMAGINIAEQRLPQDGKIDYQYSGRYVDIRTSTSPTHNGENVVLRLLDKANIVMGMGRLGLDPANHSQITELSKKPHGIVLSAGPTGSGKTTTLYSILQELDALEKNILTIEDPIEYRLPYIKQSQVNEKAGRTFAKSIRHFLRQDPDVILVGEIRDLETAKIAFQAAMTGHLVLSTIHTNDAAACIARLMDLGVESYMIPSSLRAVMAQRLVRTVCVHCQEEYLFTPDEMEMSAIKDYGITSEKRGRGCGRCDGTGYYGRSGIFEILNITPAISRLILQKVSSDQILLKAQEGGMQTMRENGIDKIKAGITTLLEVDRVTG
ncbi:MAG: type IV pilus assembly protein PilB [Desulfobacteraceae bacterium Eth-SRB2]|nr:MAG: type IV pilus assembly protein PilB [Desulfobacteraceae bacterium Eth-SRB2]